MAHQDLASCLGCAGAAVVSALPALGSSSPEGLSHQKDVPQPPCSSPAGPLAAGHGGVPSGTGGLPGTLWLPRRLSQVSMLGAVAAACCSCSALMP